MNHVRRAVQAGRHPLRTTKALRELRHPLPPFDQVPPPSEELLDIVIPAISTARSVDLSLLEARVPTGLQKSFVRAWPGEHYRLLAALTQLQSPSLTVEVGTLTGIGTLALSGSGRVVTYDLVPWTDVPDSALMKSDFETGGLEQRLGDLSDRSFFTQEVGTLSEADIVFVDAPKDGVFEPAFLRLLLPVLKPGALLVLDDIRFPSMVDLWRDLPLPKIDMTAFGHVSGTGIALK